VDPRIRYVRQATNIGLHRNLNFCLDQARGDFVCLFCDDDQYTPTIVREYVEFLTAHPGVGLLCSDWDLIDDEAHPVGVREHDAPAVMPGLDYIERTIRSGRSTVGCPGMIVRRSALGETRFEVDAPIGFGDFNVWFRVAESTDVGHIPRRLWRFRTHRTALSRRPVHSVALDFEENVDRYCATYLGRHPRDVARVSRWRTLAQRYLFWALVYELALDAGPGPTDARRRSRNPTVFEMAGYQLTPEDRRHAWELLRRHRRGAAQRIVLLTLGILLRLRLTAPLGWASQHSASFRAILGLR
jgi:glycosyltransferase involved in cell wall biosynthesis